MALTQKSVTLTNAGSGQFTLSVGMESYTIDAEDVRSIWEGRRTLDMLLLQVLLNLRAAGVNPRNSTFAQIKSAVEASPVWWGN